MRVKLQLVISHDDGREETCLVKILKHTVLITIAALPSTCGPQKLESVKIWGGRVEPGWRSCPQRQRMGS